MENVDSKKAPEQSLCTDDCLEDVIEKHSNMVYRLALSQMKTKVDADDVFQEVFIRFLRKRPEFSSEDHQKAWFIRVTLNRCKSAWTSAQKKQTIPLDESLPFLQTEQYDLLEELRKLPQKYLAVVHLYYYEDLSVAEIGKVIGKSPSAVKMRLLRAREMLKGILEEDDYV